MKREGWYPKPGQEYPLPLPPLPSPTQARTGVPSCPLALWPGQGYPPSPLPFDQDRGTLSLPALPPLGRTGVPSLHPHPLPPPCRTRPGQLCGAGGIPLALTCSVCYTGPIYGKRLEEKGVRVSFSDSRAKIIFLGAPLLTLQNTVATAFNPETSYEVKRKGN